MSGKLQYPLQVGSEVFVVEKYGSFKGKAIITKLGKKYFSIDIFDHLKFDLETLEDYRDRYSSRYRVYESELSYYQEITKSKLALELSRLISPALSYRALLEIQNIIKKDRENE